MSLQPFIIVRVHDQAMLDHFAHTTGKLFLCQSQQTGGSRVNQLRHMESANHVLIGIKIYAGLTANAGIHLGKQSGRYLNKTNAAQVGCRGKSTEISDHTATQSNQHIIPVIMVLNQEFVQIPDGVQVFIFFSRREHKKIHLFADRLQLTDHYITVKLCNCAVRHHTKSPLPHGKRSHFLSQSVIIFFHYNIINGFSIPMYCHAITHDVSTPFLYF